MFVAVPESLFPSDNGTLPSYQRYAIEPVGVAVLPAPRKVAVATPTNDTVSPTCPDIPDGVCVNDRTGPLISRLVGVPR